LNPRDLKNLREKYNLSQKELARLFGLSGQARISEYERGIRKPSKQIILLYQLLPTLIKNLTTDRTD
jgi:transcriptional regulator with XRE-family HTH domain